MAGNSLTTSIMEREDSREIHPEEFTQGGMGFFVDHLEKQHRDVMEVLAYQDDMLRQIHGRVNEREGSTVPGLPSFQAPNLFQMNSGLGTGSAGSAGSNAGLNSAGSNAGLNLRTGKDSNKLRSPGEQSVAASLFTSYSQDDMMMRLEASQASSPFRSGEQAAPSIKRTDTRVQRLARHVAFDIFFGAVVVSNAIFIGVDVGLHVGQRNTREAEFKIIQYIYTVAFTVEIALRLVAEGQDGWKCHRDDCAWNSFDLLLVLVAWLEAVFDVIQAAMNFEMENVVGVSSLRAFRIIRLTRILKTAQVIRVLRFVMALRTLVTSILSTLKALFWALLLLFLIIYIFALLFTQAVDDFIFKENRIDYLSSEEQLASDQYFGSLFHSMLTLFMSIAGGVSWEDAIAPLMAISTVWLLAFLFYVAFTYFAVLNVVTGVFCQSAIESAQQDHATVVHAMLENKEAHLTKMRAVFSEIRENCGSDDESITFAMLEEKINEPTVQQLLETLGLDVWDAWSFFKLLDTDGGGSIELEEFFMGCLRWGGNARAMELGKVLQDQQWLIRSQGKFQNFVEMELQGINEALTYLMGPMQLPVPQTKDL